MRSKLTFQISSQIGMIIFAAMLSYAIFLTGFSSGQFGTLFIRHAWHSLAIGVLIYLFLQWRLQHLVFRPLEKVLEHGHEMAHGQFGFKSYPRTHNEFEDLMHTMNYLSAHLERSKQTPWTEYANTIDAFLNMIQSREDVPLDVQGEICLIIDNLREMEWSVSQSLSREQGFDECADAFSLSGRLIRLGLRRESVSSGHKSTSFNKEISWVINNLGEEAGRLPIKTPFG